jgi:hypothetical protein
MGAILNQWRLGKTLARNTKHQVFKSMSNITVIEYRYGDQSLGISPSKRVTGDGSQIVSPDNDNPVFGT